MQYPRIPGLKYCYINESERMWKVIAFICMLTPYESCRTLDDDQKRVFADLASCDAVAETKFYETITNMDNMSAPWNRFDVWCEHFDPVDPALLDEYKG